MNKTLALLCVSGVVGIGAILPASAAQTTGSTVTDADTATVTVKTAAEPVPARFPEDSCDGWEDSDEWARRTNIDVPAGRTYTVPVPPVSSSAYGRFLYLAIDPALPDMSYVCQQMYTDHPYGSASKSGGTIGPTVITGPAQIWALSSFAEKTLPPLPEGAEWYSGPALPTYDFTGEDTYDADPENNSYPHYDPASPDPDVSPYTPGESAPSSSPVASPATSPTTEPSATPTASPTGTPAPSPSATASVSPTGTATLPPMGTETLSPSPAATDPGPVIASDSPSPAGPFPGGYNTGNASGDWDSQYPVTLTGMGVVCSVMILSLGMLWFWTRKALVGGVGIEHD